MNWQISLLLIALMVIGFVVGWGLIRPLVPRFGRWAAAHRFWTEIVASLIMIVWGAGVWYLLISNDNYTNKFAMVMSSLLICAGVYLFVRQLLMKS